MADSKGSEFIVKLNGIKLPASVEAQISREIASTVMRELARVDLKPGVGSFYIRKEWLGIWIDRLRGKIPNLRTQPF